MELAAERMVPHLMRFAVRSAGTDATEPRAMNFRRRRLEEPEINLIPFIDVLLVVLIFLMLSTTYSRFTELQIDLPAADAEQLRERPARDHRGGGQRRPLRRQPQGRGRPQRRAADRRAGRRRGRPARHAWSSSRPTPLAAHQAVVNVLDAARRAGLPRLTFATQTADAAAR